MKFLIVTFLSLFSTLSMAQSMNPFIGTYKSLTQRAVVKMENEQLVVAISNACKITDLRVVSEDLMDGTCQTRGIYEARLLKAILKMDGVVPRIVLYTYEYGSEGPFIDILEKTK